MALCTFCFIIRLRGRIVHALFYSSKLLLAGIPIFNAFENEDVMFLS